MELVKRVAYGEISELLGESALDHDKKQRLIGFARKAKAEMADLDQNSDVYCRWLDACEEANFPEEQVKPSPMTVIKPKHTRSMNTSIRKVDLDQSDNEILELDSDS